MSFEKQSCSTGVVSALKTATDSKTKVFDSPHSATLKKRISQSARSPEPFQPPVFRRRNSQRWEFRPDSERLADLLLHRRGTLVQAVEEMGPATMQGVPVPVWLPGLM